MALVRPTTSTFIFLFNATATTEIYTLSLHDALPISFNHQTTSNSPERGAITGRGRRPGSDGDRKSTRLNSSHRCISYAVFCLKKKKNKHSGELLHSLGFRPSDGLSEPQQKHILQRSQ